MVSFIRVRMLYSEGYRTRINLQGGITAWADVSICVSRSTDFKSRFTRTAATYGFAVGMFWAVG